MKEVLYILDFGSQYNQLIARRVREAKVYCRLVPFNVPLEKLRAPEVKGIILSGGPASIYQKNAPRLNPEILRLKVPILGICYGMQALVHLMGGEVRRASTREYGRAALTVRSPLGLFEGLPKHFLSWMSHGDLAHHLPKSFSTTASTTHTAIAACENKEQEIYGVQFHPEVAHTEFGDHILQNFLFRICRFKGDWTMESFMSQSLKEIQHEVGGGRVICGLSGGVDSSVTAALLSRSIGKRLSCLFVDNGLLRKGEKEQVQKIFGRQFKTDLHCVDARKVFLSALKGITDPERKRKIIGHTFIRVFEKEAQRIGGVKFLAQGTLYPDLIESRSAFGGPSAKIKSHHNVGGLPKKMNFKLIEPLKELFKDEVRVLGKKLGLSDELVGRHPFPGPGLAVRVIGAITEERLQILKEADDRFISEIRKAGLYDEIWQAFAVLLPVKTVGIMGDERTYENVVALRAVTSQDGMTADWAKIPDDVLGRVSNLIINEVRGVNRVVYDISSKPPATIEWE